LGGGRPCGAFRPGLTAAQPTASHAAAPVEISSTADSRAGQRPLVLGGTRPSVGTLSCGRAASGKVLVKRVQRRAASSATPRRTSSALPPPRPATPASARSSTTLRGPPGTAAPSSPLAPRVSNRPEPSHPAALGPPPPLPRRPRTERSAPRTCHQPRPRRRRGAGRHGQQPRQPRRQRSASRGRHCCRGRRGRPLPLGSPPAVASGPPPQRHGRLPRVLPSRAAIFRSPIRGSLPPSRRAATALTGSGPGADLGLKRRKCRLDFLSPEVSRAHGANGGAQHAEANQYKGHRESDEASPWHLCGSGWHTAGHGSPLVRDDPRGERTAGKTAILIRSPHGTALTRRARGLDRGHAARNGPRAPAHWARLRRR
jgi:hypothetical protein